MASSFRIWDNSAGIPSAPLALLIVMLPKAHLTFHSRISGSMWVITPCWLSGSLRSFLYSSVYSYHLFLISSASVAAAAAKSLQLCPTLCDPIDGSPPGSAVPGILQARTLEWIAISFSNAWKWKVKMKLLSRVWLFSDPMDCSPPGSSVHGIFQARVLEWGAIAFSTLHLRRT